MLVPFSDMTVADTELFITIEEILCERMDLWEYFSEIGDFEDEDTHHLF